MKPEEFSSNQEKADEARARIQEDGLLIQCPECSGREGVKTDNPAKKKQQIICRQCGFIVEEITIEEPF